MPQQRNANINKPVSHCPASLVLTLLKPCISLVPDPTIVRNNALQDV